MFYKLNAPYRLRGWQKRAWVLVRRPDNLTRDLTEPIFQTLLLCDGVTELDSDLLTAEMSKALSQYVQEGIVSAATEPEEIDEIQMYRFYDNRYVDSVFWSITGRCNFRCRHCFMDAPDAALGELSTEQVLSFIDQMADCGILKVDITGGEPFVRRDFWQLVDYLAEKEITIGQIYTNGWLMNGKVLDALEIRGFKPEISISFDGVGWHDWMRGIPGAEEVALRAFRLCRDRNFLTSAEMCIHRGNAHTLAETVKLLEDCGVSHLKTSNVSATELWCRNSEGNAMTDREYFDAMIAYIPEYFRSGTKMSIMLSNVASLFPAQLVAPGQKRYELLAERYDGTEKCLNCHLCGAVRWSCYITPEGRLLPCMPMTASPKQDEFPLIQDISLKQGLSDSYYMQYIDYRVKDLLAVNAECAACEYRYKCGGGCRASALVESDHDIMGADRSQCILWKEGYVDRIRQSAEEAVAQYCKSTEE